MKRIAMGSWAYAIGPYESDPIDFDQVMPALAAEDLPDDWWTIDLCFRPDAWAATAECKRFVDGLNEKFG